MAIFTGRIWTLDPHKVTCQDVHPQLIPKCRLSIVLVGSKWIPFNCLSLLSDTEVSAVDTHRTVIRYIITSQSAFKDYLQQSCTHDSRTTMKN